MALVRSRTVKLTRTSKNVLNLEVAGIKPFQSKVEITCRNNDDADILNRDLQQNQELNNFYSFEDKTPKLQIATFFYVPESFTADHIYCK